MKKRVCYIISDINKSLAFEWIATNINKEHFELQFILIGNKDSVLETFLKKNDIHCYSLRLSSKLLYPIMFLKICFLLIKEMPDVVHCHLLKANLLGLTAAAILLIPIRIHTRHHSTYHHTYHPKGVKLDRLSNFLSTHIIAISQNVKEVLINKENVPEEMIYVVPHGFDLDFFKEVKDIETVRKKYFDTKKPYPVIGVVARYITWKGIQYVIRAFHNLLLAFPNAHLLLANATGPDQELIKSLLSELPTDSYTEITFEDNIAALYQLMDVYVHVPTDADIEAFGQTYIEALAAGIPAVFTLSGIAKEFILHENNALIVSFEDSTAIYLAIKRLLTDNALRMRVIKQGKADVRTYNLTSMIKSLEQMYVV